MNNLTPFPMSILGLKAYNYKQKKNTFSGTTLYIREVNK